MCLVKNFVTFDTEDISGEVSPINKLKKSLQIYGSLSHLTLTLQTATTLKQIVTRDNRKLIHCHFQLSLLV